MRRVGPVVTRLAVAAIVVAFGLGPAAPAGAEPGDLDGAFGICGFAPTTEDFPPSVLTGDGGKYLELSSGLPSITATSVTIARRLADGRLDRSFGVRGRATVSIPGWVSDQYLDQLSVDHARRVLASIRADITPGEVETRGFVVRLTPSGQLDTSFGGGVVRTDLQSLEFVVGPGNDLIGAGGASPTESLAASIHISESGIVNSAFELAALPGASAVRQFSVEAIQPDGKVLGVDRTFGTANPYGAVLRWNADGSVDPAFSPIRPQDLGGGVGGTFDVTVSTGGTIVVLAWTTTSRAWSPKAVVARYRSDGTLDASFGSSGSVVVPTLARRHALAIDDDGRISIVSGVTLAGEQRPRIVRLLPNGALDPRFGTNGVSTLGTASLRSTARLPDAWHVATLLTAAGEFNALIPVTARVSNVSLTAGAGLLLQWNGDAWPTRLGRDPGPECPVNTPYWPDDDNARGITTVPGRGGYVADLFGGIHPFSVGLRHPKPAPAVGSPYWPGWDIVRGIAAKPDGTGGYVLDGFGGLHAFHTGANPQPPRTVGSPYWPGWNITRGVALLPDGTRGYVLDGFGGVHRFTTPGRPLPPKPNGAPYWPGWDIARGISILGDGTGGYIVDGFGGIHPFGIGTSPPPPPPGRGGPYVPGTDWVRGFAFIEPIPSALSTASASGARATDSAVTTRATARRRGPTPVGPASR